MALTIMSHADRVPDQTEPRRDHPRRSGRRSRHGAVWLERGLLGLAVAAAAILRFRWILGQILTDDEWHALNKLLTSGYFAILSDFGLYDHSIPLTLYDKLLSRTLGLSEFSMRAPSLLAGTLAVAWIPLLLRPFLGTRSSLLLAWMLALAPLQVHYSRIARPYAITVPLTITALVAFHDWLSRRGQHRKAVFLGAWTLGGAFHLPTLISIPGPFLFGLLESRWNPSSNRRSTRQLLGAGAVLALCLGLVLALPLVNSVTAVSTKLGMDRPSGATIKGLVELFFGVTTPWLLAILGALATLGCVGLIRRDPRPVIYAIFAATVQVVVLIGSAPQRLDASIALARYCLWMQPLLLAVVAVGVTRVEEALPRARRYPWLAAPLLASLAFCGPLGNIYRWPNNWTGHPALQDFHRPLPSLRFPSPFYDRLATQPAGRLLILEAPWSFHRNAYVFHQRRHRQRMMIGFIDRDPSRTRAGEAPRTGSGIHLRNAVHVADIEEIQRRRIDFVIFHKRIAQEMADPHFAPLPPLPVGDWVDQYREACGPPEFEDSAIAVFAPRRCAKALK